MLETQVSMLLNSKRDINTVYTKEFLDSHRESPWGKTQRDQKMGLEFDENDYKIIDEYCKKKLIGSHLLGMLILKKFLKKFNLKYNKVAFGNAW